MICAQDRLSQVSWQKLTAAGRAVLDAVQAGGGLPLEVMTVWSPDDIPGFARSWHGPRRRSQNLKCLEQKNVPSAEELGEGTLDEQGFCRSLILLRLPRPALLLKDFIHRHYTTLTVQQKRRFLVTCARFVGRLHDAGVAVSGALDRALLVSVAGEPDQFYLNGAQLLFLCRGPLGTRLRFKAVGALFAATFNFTTRSERLRFVAAYLGTTRFDEQSRRHLHRLERAARREALRHWHRYSLRCLGSNRDFVHERRDGFRVHHLRSSAVAEALGRLLPDPDRAFADAVIYKPGSRTHAGLVFLGGRRYFLKRYNAPTSWFCLVNVFRRSRALRTWLATWGFIARGLPVARPVICLEKRRWRLLGSCYILMEFVEGTAKLSTVWPRLDRAGREKCLLRLGSVLGRLHYSGGLHGDLKWNNIVLSQDDPAAVHLVDFDGSRVVRWPSLRRGRRDLDRFLRDFRGYDVPEHLIAVLCRIWGRWTGVR